MYSAYVLKWWKLDVMPGYSYIFQDGTNIDEEIKNVTEYFQFRISSNISLWKGARFVINTFYRTSYNSPQGKQDGYGRTNLSLRQLFFDNKLTLTIGAKDPFGQSKLYNYMQQSDFIQNRAFEFERSIYEISLRYNFGQLKVAGNEPGINILNDDEN